MVKRISINQRTRKRALKRIHQRPARKWFVIDKLTHKQKARMKEWADKWIAIGLRTGAAECEKFANSAAACYRAASVAWPGNVVWVASPVALRLTAPLAAVVIALRRHGMGWYVASDALRDLVDCAVHHAVGDDAVGQAMRRAVLDAVNSAVRDAVGDDAVGAAEPRSARHRMRRVLREIEDCNIGGEIAPGYHISGEVMRFAVQASVQRAVVDPVVDATHCVYAGIVFGGVILGAARSDSMLDGISAVSARHAANGAGDESVDYHKAVGKMWQCAHGAGRYSRGRYFDFHGGDVWMGSRIKGTRITIRHPACTHSFYRAVCGLPLGEGASAFDATLEATHLWHSYRDFVMVCERPAAIHREPRQGMSYQILHCADGPAIAYPDGWGVYAVHGVQIPFWQRHIVERPEAITAEEIAAEENPEILGLMIARAPGGWQPSPSNQSGVRALTAPAQGASQ